MEPDQKSRVIWAIVAIIIIVVLLFVLPGNSLDEDRPEGDVEISVEQIDLDSARNEEAKLPKGFPTDIPIPDGTIKESYTSSYKDKGYTQHTVVYETSDSMNSIHKLYEVFMTAAGYDVTNSSVTSDLSSVYGTRDNDDLTVVITPTSQNKREVSLNYLDRR